MTRLTLALALAYPGTTPDYWLERVDDDELIAAALDLIPRPEED